ncbi:MAG: protoporphyrinogen oxidase [Planctomycetes bacterium]|nr:protoporphyrinogen oxidase [Planctomycetota bacterium]NOG54138.1 protoporphyrinogen oxidase [Planctomycetota bacterium]
MSESSTKYDVLIVGGGIAGLSTAWHLVQQAAEQGRCVRIGVVEASDRWGGKIRTDIVHDPESDRRFLIEGGPDSFITQKPEGLKLARDLGLGDRILSTNTVRRAVYVLKRGKPLPLPDGVLLIVPTEFVPFALSPLISPLGKLRMGLDLFIRARKDESDETLADFIRRRLGQEALDRIAEPLMAGIYNAEAERQSLLATFPRFRMIEQKYGSLIKGMLAAKAQRASHAPPPGSPPPPTMFVSLQGGASELIETLIKSLEASGVELRPATRVERVEPQGSEFAVALSGAQREQRVSASAVILATPAFHSADLVRPIAPEAAGLLETIRYVSTGTITMGFLKSDVPRPIDGFGLVIPRSENRCVNAITCSSIKWSGRAPDDCLLMRAFFGGSRRPDMMDLDDEQLLEQVMAEVTNLTGATPDRLLVHRIYRWHRGNPQYDVGHLERVDQIEQQLPDGLYVTGSPYRGIGIPDCAAQGKVTAERVMARLAGTGTDTAQAMSEATS